MTESHRWLPIEYRDEDSPAWRRAVLHILECWGILEETGKTKLDADGVRCPTYYVTVDPEEFDREYSRAEVYHALYALEAKGLIKKTGEYRIGPDGVDL